MAPSLADFVAANYRAEGLPALAELVEARAQLGVLRYGVALSSQTPDLGAHLACEVADGACYAAALGRGYIEDDARAALVMTQAEVDRLRVRRIGPDDGRQLEFIAAELVRALDAHIAGDALGCVSAMWLAAQRLTGSDWTADQRTALRMWLRERQRGSGA